MKTSAIGYIDGYVAPIPRKNLKAYRKMAQLSAKVWMEHGALQYFECMGNDVPSGKITSFAKSVKLKKGEVVFFSWVAYRSRAHRDRVNKKVMADPRLMNMMENMPFDGMRMIWGGFKPFLKY